MNQQRTAPGRPANADPRATSLFRTTRSSQQKQLIPLIPRPERSAFRRTPPRGPYSRTHRPGGPSPSPSPPRPPRRPSPSPSPTPTPSPPRSPRSPSPGPSRLSNTEILRKLRAKLTHGHSPYVHQPMKASHHDPHRYQKYNTRMPRYGRLELEANPKFKADGGVATVEFQYPKVADAYGLQGPFRAQLHPKYTANPLANGTRRHVMQRHGGKQAVRQWGWVIVNQRGRHLTNTIPDEYLIPKYQRFKDTAVDLANRAAVRYHLKRGYVAEGDQPKRAAKAPGVRKKKTKYQAAPARPGPYDASTSSSTFVIPKKR